jgi:Protein of unknown function (DUF3999)
MNIPRVAAFSLFILQAGMAARADEQPAYAYAWPLQTQGDSAAWQVQLTPEVYAAISTEDLRDLAVINGASEAVPFALDNTVARAVSLDTAVDLPLFNLPELPRSAAGDETIRLHIDRGPDGRLRRLDAQVGGAAVSSAAAPASGQRDLLLDASAVHAPLSGLRIAWSDTAGDVTAQFSISASDDLQQWRALVPNATVLNLKQDGNSLARHTIALNDVRAAYLRMHRLDDGPALPGLTVQAHTMSLSSNESNPDLWLEATPESGTAQLLYPTLAPGDARQRTFYAYHLPAVLDIRSVRLALVDDNSIARVELESRRAQAQSDPNSWLACGGGIAFRLRQGDSIIDNDDWPISPSRRARDWRIELTTPLQHAPNLAVAYRPDRFVFLAQGAGPYRLVAGSANARRGDYPVDTALAQLRAKLGADWQPPLTTLGARAVLAGQGALEAAVVAPVERDWKTWLLWGLLVGAAAVVGALALSLLRGPRN